MLKTKKFVYKQRPVKEPKKKTPKLEKPKKVKKINKKIFV